MVRLRDILDVTRARVARLHPEAARLRAEAGAAPRPPDWAGAFGRSDVAVIAEVKRRSPSAGAIAPELDPVGHATAYAAGGAAAISVLTETAHFGGSVEDLRRVAAAVSVPVLRKDFVLDPVQLYEARAAGASAVLLIVRALDTAALRDLAALAAELGLARLVEVHGAQELDVALAVAPEAIGVNSRDLDTFTVDPARTAPLLARVPAGTTAIAESGVQTRADVERAAAWGADAVLVGTALARAPRPAESTAGLVGVPRSAPRAAAETA